MNNKILLITHENIGSALLRTAKRTYSNLPIPAKVIPVDYHSAPENVILKLEKIAEQMSPNDGLLILTDMFGSTPCNIALALQDYKHIHVVSGLNLPMLLKVMNYPGLALRKLVQKAIQGGKDGVVSCTREYRKICEEQ